MRLELEQGYTEALSHLEGRPPLRLGIGGTSPDHGEEPPGSERSGSGDGEERGIHAAGVTQHHAAHIEQMPLQHLEIRHAWET